MGLANFFLRLNSTSCGIAMHCFTYSCWYRAWTSRIFWICIEYAGNNPKDIFWYQSTIMHNAGKGCSMYIVAYLSFKDIKLLPRYCIFHETFITQMISCYFWSNLPPMLKDQLISTIKKTFLYSEEPAERLYYELIMCMKKKQYVSACCPMIISLKLNDYVQTRILKIFSSNHWLVHW